MKNFLIICLVALVAGGASSYFGLTILDRSNVKGKVLAVNIESEITVTSTVTLTTTSTPTPTNTPTPTLTPSPSLTPTPTAPPQPEFTSEQINGFIESFAGQYSVDPNVLRHIAVCESGFDPNAAHLSYAGLYQFGSTAWIKYRQEIGEDTDPGLRFNVEEAVQTAAYILATNRAYIWPNCVP